MKGIGFILHINYPDVAAWFAKGVPRYSPIFLDGSDEEEGLSFPRPQGFIFHVWIHLLPLSCLASHLKNTHIYNKQ